MKKASLDKKIYIFVCPGFRILNRSPIGFEREYSVPGPYVYSRNVGIVRFLVLCRKRKDYEDLTGCP